MTKSYVKVTLEDNDYFETWINLPKDEAVAYYMGQVLNMGVVEDKMLKVINVEVLKEETIK